MESQNSHIQLTADIVIEYPDKSIVLIKRRKAPFEGSWALPGGKMQCTETIQQTAIREAKEETGLDIQLIKIIGVYSEPNRDPRGRYISIVFLAYPIGGMLQASSDAKELIKTKDSDQMQLAFDHSEMLADYFRIVNGS